MKKIRFGWFSTHPIQYQAPLLQTISAEPAIDLKAYFFSDFSTKSYHDNFFGRSISWDTPLFDGYKYEFLKGNGSEVSTIKFLSPKVTNLKEVITPENLDVILVQGWQNINMIRAAKIAHDRGIKVINRCEATDHFTTSSGLKKSLREKIVSYLFKNVDAFMSIGSHNSDFYKSRGISENKIYSMPYSIDNQKFNPEVDDDYVRGFKEKFDIQEGNQIILYSGKLMKRKNPDKLLESYSKLEDPKPYLLFAGDGELRQELESFTEKNDLKNVRFLGFCNQKELPQIYKMADIFILPSIEETWGLVINEAMSAGCAIITTTSVGSARDLVQDGVNGYRAERIDVEEIRKLIEKTLEGGEYRKMAKKSQEIISSWSFRECVTGLNQALEDLIQK